MIGPWLENSFLNKHRMTPFRQAIKSTLVRLTANRRAQDLLEEIVQTAHVLQGVGGGSTGGSEVHTSGEMVVFDLLKQTMKPPYCIFDVGANRGQFLNLLLQYIGTVDYRIHCFEPGHEVFGILKDSFGTNEKITFNNFAMGKEICCARLHYDAAGSGCASLTKRKLDHLGIFFDKSEQVRISTIDEYCLEKGIEHIQLVKVDVEGHELDVFNGARKMFDNRRIDIVSFEFGGCNVDTRTFFQDFWYFFTEAGMNLYRITPSGYLYPVESYSEIHEKCGVSNFVAKLCR